MLNEAEEARAAQWREDQDARVAFQTYLAKRRAGSSAAVAALRAQWQPFADYLAEIGVTDADEVRTDPTGV